MHGYLLAALAACLLIAGDAPSGDMSALEGRWPGGVWVFSGDLTLVVDIKNPVSVLEISDGTATLRSCSGGTERWAYALDKSREPKTIDLTVLDGPDQGKVRRAIYQIKPNRYGGGYYLSLCIAGPGASRPSEFVHKPEAGWQLHSFARYPDASKQGKLPAFLAAPMGDMVAVIGPGPSWPLVKALAGTGVGADWDDSVMAIPGGCGLSGAAVASGSSWLRGAVVRRVSFTCCELTSDPPALRHRNAPSGGTTLGVPRSPGSDCIRKDSSSPHGRRRSGPP